MVQVPALLALLWSQGESRRPFLLPSRLARGLPPRTAGRVVRGRQTGTVPGTRKVPGQQQLSCSLADIVKGLPRQMGDGS